MNLFFSQKMEHYYNDQHHVLVISRYEDDIVITRDRGGAEVECNNNPSIRDITVLCPIFDQNR